MQIFKLRNSLTLVIEKRKADSIAIQATVKAGPINETKNLSGVSHFLEHMLFEGTKKRNDARIISNEIESLGGEINAYTSNERTCFYIKVPKKHFQKALEILSDIIQNPLFNNKKIEKERKIILKEINMCKDEPRFHQWAMFQKALFGDSPAGNPASGTVQSVNRLKRKDLLGYYNKYYVPNNTIISVVGDTKDIKSNIEKRFGKFRPKKLPEMKKISEARQSRITVKKQKRKVLNSYMVLGYKTPNRLGRDSYALDVIKSILGRGQSGRIYDEIRNKRGLAYEVGICHEPSAAYGFFAVYSNTHKKNIPLIIKITLDEFRKLKNLAPKELNEAKGYLEGQFILNNEDTHERTDELAFWASVKDAKLYNNYLKEIRRVKKRDILRVADEYLTNNYTMVVIEQS